MNLLKRENWWIWLILLLFSSGASPIVLGAMLNLFEKGAWYSKWYVWVIGLILIIPFPIMIYVLYISITCKTAAKLEVKGYEYYLSPYIWMILMIIPFIGWIVFIILFIYLNIQIILKLKAGNAEKFI